MSEREKILARIREALSVPAPRPGSTSGPAREGFEAKRDARQWLPPAGENFEEHLAQFAAAIKELRATLLVVSDLPELARRLCELRDQEGWKSAATHSGTLAEAAAEALQLPLCRTDSPPGYDVRQLEACDVGITECDALIAQTGSVLVTSRSAGGRALSVLPPHHVVLARKEQLIRDLPAAFALLEAAYGEDYPSMISFVTGPSRTGDIERILVLGAHGPKKLTIFILGAGIKLAA